MRKLKGVLALLAGTCIWGSAFIAQSVGMDWIEPFTFQAVRSGLAVVFLFPCAFLWEQDKGQFWRHWKNPKLWRAGMVCGAALFAASGLQQMGLVYTAAGKAGFITAMYIVLVPILGAALGRRIPATAWVSVALAVAGLYLLSCVGVTQVNRGDLLLLGAALCFSVQITLIDHFSGDLDGIHLNCIQCLTCAVLSALVMGLTENPSLAAIWQCRLPLCYAGILSMGVAYTLQIVGQRELDATTASLLMSLESVFAVLFGWLLLHESMTYFEIIGCCLMFGAVLLSQLPAHSAAKA